MILKRNTNNCCAFGCRNKQKNSKLSFFKFPKDAARRNEWFKGIGRSDLLNKTDLKYDSYKVCSAHFEESMLVEVAIRKLRPDALPTLFLDNPPPQSTYADASTQTTESFEELLALLKIKNETLNEEHDSQTTQARPPGAPRIRNLGSHENNI